MKAQRTFCEALAQLDHGASSRGEALLREAINNAEREDDELILGGALCRLGELLMMEHRSMEARPILARVLEIRREDSALFFEVDRARELLGAPSAPL